MYLMTNNREWLAGQFDLFKARRSPRGRRFDTEGRRPVQFMMLELGKAVKILSVNGLHPLNTGARVSFTKGKSTVTDGPFIETKEVLGG
jgi:hypothetical protein